WGANWLSGWISHHRPWREEHLGLEAHEWIAGFIHIGTERMIPPERPRPDLTKITTWVET
ncbi:MAG: nitroreductase, partial [Boseongicola sp.]|nr:nitroreductase [Boseongicola sp.]